jgi:hypothetical protein
VIGRRTFLVALGSSVVLRGDDREAIEKWLNRVAAYLTEENPDDFLKAFRKDIRERLSTNVWAMFRNAEVASSVELLSLKGDKPPYEVELDWYLKLVPRTDATPAETRREVIKMKLEPAKKNWLVIELAETKLFAAPK